MEKNLNIGVRREFLNEDYLTSLTAMIGYSIKLYTWKETLIKEGLFDNTEIEFAITSCNTKANFDFSIDSKEAMRNSLHKLDTIISVCESMRKDLKEARLYINKGVKRWEEIEEQEELKRQKNARTNQGYR